MYKICAICQNKEICKLYDTIINLDPIKVTDCKYFIESEESKNEFKENKKTAIIKSQHFERDYNSVNDYIKSQAMKDMLKCPICGKDVNKEDALKCDKCNRTVCQSCVDIEIEGNDTAYSTLAICTNCNPNKVYHLESDSEYYTIQLNNEDDFNVFHKEDEIDF